MLHKLRFTTSYSQFYLYDKGSPGDTDSPEFWTDAALIDKLAYKAGILGISIGTYSYVNAAISILNQSDEVPDLASYDHVVEGSMEIRSGILQVLDCPDSAVALELFVLPGLYRVRVYASGLDSINDEFEEAEDFYRIEMWPAAPSGRHVLKRAVFDW